MNITLNGEHKNVRNDLTVTALLADLGYEGQRLAVERNGDIVPKSQHATTLIAEGDILEIVIAVGGG